MQQHRAGLELRRLEQPHAGKPGHDAVCQALQAGQAPGVPSRVGSARVHHVHSGGRVWPHQLQALCVGRVVCSRVPKAVPHLLPQGQAWPLLPRDQPPPLPAPCTTMRCALALSSATSGPFWRSRCASARQSSSAAVAFWRRYSLHRFIASPVLASRPAARAERASAIAAVPNASTLPRVSADVSGMLRMPKCVVYAPRDQEERQNLGFTRAVTSA